ncbi:MAG: metallophosphoesterase [Solobacterium sp.]|nr:metallophosphoesterase [Solobacterium sp.]
MKQKILKLLGCISAVVMLMMLGTGLYLWTHITNEEITTCYYEVDAGFPDSVRIVVLADLHEKEFGPGNEALIDAVSSLDPDIVCMVGDMQNRDDENPDIVLHLVSALAEKYPVYFCYGNHEDSWQSNFGRSFGQLMTNAGAVVLDGEYVDTALKGKAVRIGGFMGYYRFTGMLKTEDPGSYNRFFDAFEDTDRYKILLNHIPTQWIDWGHMDDFDVDLVFCGHYHGGQMVLPFVGPLYAPYIGLRPPYVKGMFEGEKATVILSAGLGNEYWFVPRVNNPPELTVVDLN